ncbi:MAG: mobilization protein [Verrucomicrobiota bacterium JB023]|nr:mobilization protein [Verrucomicrobiota bacterium JB023]
MKPTIHLVGGEKGGVGKSVFSRYLAQYFIDEQIPFAGLDSDRSHQSFSRFYSDYTSSIDLEDPESLDHIVEAVLEQDSLQVLVDLAAQSAKPLWNWFSEAEVLDLLQENGIRLMCWHVLDDSRDGVEMLGKLLDQFGDQAQYVVVLNQGRGQDFTVFHRSPERDRLNDLGGSVIDFPKLHHGTMSKIDMADASFWAAANNPAGGLALMDRQRAKVWLKRARAAVQRALT